MPIPAAVKALASRRLIEAMLEALQRGEPSDASRLAVGMAAGLVAARHLVAVDRRLLAGMMDAIRTDANLDQLGLTELVQAIIGAPETAPGGVECAPEVPSDAAASRRHGGGYGAINPDAMQQAFCEAVLLWSQGMTAKEACRIAGFSVRTWHHWMKSRPELRTKMVLARSRREMEIRENLSRVPVAGRYGQSINEDDPDFE